MEMENVNDTMDNDTEIFLNATVGQNEDFNLSMLGPQRDSLYIVIPITIIYAVIFFTGVVGNVSTCIVIARNKSMHTATNYYLFSLAVSDLLLLVTGLPQEMYSIWSRYPYVFGELFCVLRGLASETSANATVLTITAFTVERYVAICHPFLSHTMSKLSRAVKLILAVWLIAFSFAVPQALQFGLVNYRGTAECLVKKIIIQHSFELSTFLFFVAPMTLITVLYALIGLRLRTSNMMKRNSGSVRTNGNNSRRSCRHQPGQSSRRVLKMLVAVVVAFFICWAPFHAQRLVAIYSNSLQAAPPYKLKLYELITYVSGVLYYVSTTVNPVLYHIMSNKFREAFKETFRRWCGQCGERRRGSGGRLSDRRSCYSVLSRSGNGNNKRGTGAPDSSESGTSVTHRHSEDSNMCTHPQGRTHTQNEISMSPPAKPEYYVVSLHRLNIYDSPKKSSRLADWFQCLARQTLDDKKLQPYTPSPISEHCENKSELSAKFHIDSYEVSNSSLRDIDNGALEDELTIYMKEIQRREKDKS